MKGKDFVQKAFDDFKKDLLNSFMKYTSTEKENKSLKIENKEKNDKTKPQEAQINSPKNENKPQEAQINSLKNEKKETEYKSETYRRENIYVVQKEVYNAYDKLQNDNIGMETEKNEAESIELNEIFEKFKGYVEKIDIISDNIGSPSNHEENKNDNDDENLLSTNEINDIINHEFGKNLEKNEFLEAFRKAILKNVNINWIK